MGWYSYVTIKLTGQVSQNVIDAIKTLLEADDFFCGTEVTREELTVNIKTEIKYSGAEAAKQVIEYLKSIENLTEIKVTYQSSEYMFNSYFRNVDKTEEIIDELISFNKGRITTTTNGLTTVEDVDY